MTVLSVDMRSCHRSNTFFPDQVLGFDLYCPSRQLCSDRGAVAFLRSSPSTLELPLESPLSETGVSNEAYRKF